jgi:hypothetical protein
METFRLNAQEIAQFIKRKSLAISCNQNLELNDGKLVINCNGFISEVLSISIDFNQSEIDNKLAISFIQNLISEHLNLEPSMIIFVSQNEQEYVFKIRFSYKVIWNIVVCESRTAINNTRALYDETVDFAYQASNIGPYKKLGDSAYYFRWFVEF